MLVCPTEACVTPAPASTAAKVTELWTAGLRASDIAGQLGLQKATITYHLRRLRAAGPATYIGRRAIVTTLGGSGVRVSELCDMRIRDLRLHAASGAHFLIPDAKTEAGVREVQVSPDLLEEIVAHIDRLQRSGLPTEPDAHLFPNMRGGRMKRHEPTRSSARWRLSGLAARGLPSLPNSTPHTLRRTYISVALLANRFDVLWVMRQVGHADSRRRLDGPTAPRFDGAGARTGLPSARPSVAGRCCPRVHQGRPEGCAASARAADD